MKFCAFGGFLFLGGCMALVAACFGMEWIGTTYCMQVPLYFGIGSIILGLLLGFYGLWRRDDSHRM